MKHLIALVVCLLGSSVYAQSEAELLKNQNLFRANCGACHSVGCNRNGPKLEGVIGRKAGVVADFKYYSSELKGSGIVWSDKAIDEYIADPGKMVPGTSMAGVGQIVSASERQGIVAHVRRQDKSIDLCI
jgi:cytochrome c